jgi:Flp pilus assembly pilin Flp
MKKTVCKLWQGDEGQDLAEYGLLLVLVAIFIVASITALKDHVAAALSTATSVLAGS